MDNEVKRNAEDREACHVNLLHKMTHDDDDEQLQGHTTHHYHHHKQF